MLQISFKEFPVSKMSAVWYSLTFINYCTQQQTVLTNTSDISDDTCYKSMLYSLANTAVCLTAHKKSMIYW